MAGYLHPAAPQWASGSNKGLGTEDACLVQPPSGTRLQAQLVPLEEAVWRHQTGCWRPESVKWKDRGGSGDKRVGSEEAASGDPLEAHLASHLCITQRLRGGWPPWGGRPSEALWRAAGARDLGIVNQGYIKYRCLGIRIV